MMKDVSPTGAALGGLIVIQGVMLASLFAGVPPHPPQAVAPFAMGPFLGAALAAPVAALLLRDEATGAGRVLSVVAILAALVSFGPHKWFDPAFPQIWPSVVGAQIAIGVVVWRLAALAMAQKAAAATPRTVQGQ